MSAALSRSERAPGLLLGEGVVLPDSVDLGGNVIVHAGTRVGEGTTEVTTYKNLIVRLQAPRFFTERDVTSASHLRQRRWWICRLHRGDRGKDF